MLLPGGRTAHSKFRIPIQISFDSTCFLPRLKEHSELLRKAEIIIWDEAPMMHRWAFEALDRSLRDIMSQDDKNNENLPFGNKLILCGGDFRQILPVIKKGSIFFIF